MRDKYKKNLENNIRNITAVVALRNFILFTAVVIPFFGSLGLDFFHIMLIETSFALTVLIMEVPSGYLADKFGRRKIIIIGSLFGFVGMLIYSFSSTFEFFVLSESLIGFACSFISGADSAILYDSLKELKREDEYKKIEGRREAIRTTAIGLAALLSGIIATFSFRANFFLTALTALISVIFALKLVEPKKAYSKSNVITTKFVTVLKETLQHKELILMILFSATIFGFSTAHFFVSQKFLEVINMPLIYFGLIFALANFGVAALSLFAYKIEKKIGLFYSMVLATIFAASSFFIFGLTPTLIGIIGIFTYQFARGIRTPIVKDFINKRTESSRRATVLSFDGFFGRGLFVIVSPIIGFLTVAIGFSTATIILGIIIATGLLGTTLLLKLIMQKN